MSYFPAWAKIFRKERKTAAAAAAATFNEDPESFDFRKERKTAAAATAATFNEDPESSRMLPPDAAAAAAAFNEIREVKPQCYIYRVPIIIRRGNEEAYTPQLISIGPLHHGKQELADMENKKKEYKDSFFEQRKTEENKLMSFIKDNENQIRSHYAETSTLQSPKFIMVILYDSIFIIEIFLRRFENKSDMLLATIPLYITLCRDLQLFENQLPYSVLKDVYELAFINTTMPTFVELSCNFFKSFEGLELSEITFQKTPKHFTDWKRITLLRNYQRSKEGNGTVVDLPCAMKLNELGVQFKHIDFEGNNLFDIRFKKSRHLIPLFEVHELQIPRLLVNDETEHQLRNIIALEQCLYPDETLVCCYVNLMDYLINTKKDMDLFVRNEIISNHMGDNASVAKMFNKLNQNMCLSQSPYYCICEQLKDHYMNPWNRARAKWNRAKVILKRVYFNNPWTGTTTVAAIILLLLTIVQTVCSVLQVV